MVPATEDLKIREKLLLIQMFFCCSFQNCPVYGFIDPEWFQKTQGSWLKHPLHRNTFHASPHQILWYTPKNHRFLFKAIFLPKSLSKCTLDLPWHLQRMVIFDKILFLHAWFLYLIAITALQNYSWLAWYLAYKHSIFIIIYYY